MSRILSLREVDAKPLVRGIDCCDKRAHAGLILPFRKIIRDDGSIIFPR